MIRNFLFSLAKYFPGISYYCPHTKYDWGFMFSVCLSVHQREGEGTSARTRTGYPLPHPSLISLSRTRRGRGGAGDTPSWSSPTLYPSHSHHPYLWAGICHRQDMTRAVRILRLHAGGLCFIYFFRWKTNSRTSQHI